jgi:uncharacterized protein
MRELRWGLLDGEGIEHVAFDERDDGFHVDSVVVGEIDGRRYGLSWCLHCDPRWRTRELTLQVTSGATLTLRGDGKGHWHDGHGLPLSLIEGCIDVDVIATPFTNTLPIRRLSWQKGARQTIDVAWISVPDLQLTRASQAYTCLVPERRFRYESVGTGFTAELDVDDDGIVIDYEGIWKRISS